MCYTQGMEGRNLSVTITSSTIVTAILFVLLVAVLWFLRDIVLIVLTAVVIASALEPAIAAIVRQKIPRIIAVILVYFLVFFAFFLIFYFFVPTVLEDLTTFISQIPSYIDTLSRAGFVNYYSNIFGFSTDATASAVVQNIRDGIAHAAVFSNAFTAAAVLFGGFFSTILIAVFSFYFAVLQTGIEDFLRIVVPKKNQRYALNLWKRSQSKIGLWMQGQILLAAIMGVLVFLGLTIFSVPHALVLAMIAAMMEIIPVFGPGLAAIPAVAMAFVAGGAGLGVVTIVIFTIAQQFENHLIYPLVVTRVVGVPPMLVILALLIGGQLAGFLGIILAVPLAAMLQEFVNDFKNEVSFSD